MLFKTAIISDDVATDAVDVQIILKTALVGKAGPRIEREKEVLKGNGCRRLGVGGKQRL